MASFDLAIKTVLNPNAEGGFSNDPDDVGGPTNHGISLAFLQSIEPSATIDDVTNLSEENAIAIYKKYFWDHYKLEQIADQSVANKILNMFVNLVPATATKIIQNAVNRFSDAINLIVDGVFGSKTISAINSYATPKLLDEIILGLIRHYVTHAQDKFLRGLVKRALS